MLITPKLLCDMHTLDKELFHNDKCLLDIENSSIYTTTSLDIETHSYSIYIKWFLISSDWCWYSQLVQIFISSSHIRFRVLILSASLEK